MVNCSPQLPESPNTGCREDISFWPAKHAWIILTDEAEVVAGHDIWDGHLNAALADVEVMRDEDRSLDVSRAEQDEAVGVGDVHWTTGSLPIISRGE